MRSVSLVFLALALSAAPALAAPKPASPARPTRIEVQGHRGSRGTRPENTLPAFEFAIENGADTLELDIAVTADGELVISHDPEVTPDRCLDPAGQPLKEPIIIHTLKYAELARYDCGTLKNPRFPRQEPVPKTPKPRLEDLFQMVEKSKLPGAATVNFNIETKIYPSKPELTPPPAEFARMIIELVRKHHMVARSILQSFDDRTLLASKKIEPKLRTSMLTSDNHIDYVAVARSAHADIISPDYDWILPDDVRALHRAGIKVLPWTVDDPQGWDRMIEAGVDGIISDYPKDLAEYLKGKGRR